MTLNMIQKLYRLEISLKDKSSQEKYQLHQVKAKTLLEQFNQWLGKANVVSKSAVLKYV